MSFMAGYLLGLEDGGGGTTTADIVDIIDSQEPLASIPLVKDYWCKLSLVPADVVLYPKIQVSYNTYSIQGKPALFYKASEKKQKNIVYGVYTKMIKWFMHTHTQMNYGNPRTVGALMPTMQTQMTRLFIIHLLLKTSILKTLWI